MNRRGVKGMGRIAALLGLLGLSLAGFDVMATEDITGADIVQRCDMDKNPGQDQKTVLTVTLKDIEGNERKNVYNRFWIDSKGKKKIADKMILFTDFPPDARGTGFMRWGYVAGMSKNAEQWIYLPALSSVRRVSVRDPGDSFLGSDLTYQDISPRALDADTHTLLDKEKRNGETYYVVESIPKEKKPLYGKIKAWYKDAPDWANCNKERIEFYDPRGSLLKTEELTWQKVGDAWVWDEVLVENRQTGHSSLFGVTNVRINTGLKESYFSERTLKRGMR